MDESVDLAAWEVDERYFPRAGSFAAQAEFLLRYALLAPSIFNTQPWRFTILPDSVLVAVDHERWLRVADADQRELYLSAGCAIENMVVAAERFGFRATVSYCPSPGEPEVAARVRLAPGETIPTTRAPLFAAITRRRSNPAPFTARPVPAELLGDLQAAAFGAGIRLLLPLDSVLRSALVRLTLEADARQCTDSSWRAEQHAWMGRGAAGTPRVLAQLHRVGIRHLDLERSIARRHAAMLRSAPVLGLLTGMSDDRGTQVQVGQAFERLGLLATSRGLSIHPMSQSLQVPATREALAALMPEPGMIPLLPFRLGYTPAVPRPTSRRALAAVIGAPPAGVAAGV